MPDHIRVSLFQNGEYLGDYSMPSLVAADELAGDIKELLNLESEKFEMRNESNDQILGQTTLRELSMGDFSKIFINTGAN
ncbi:MAG: hypothetical protein LBM27_04525 [Lactobacillaceae bacterium]|jgi:hypothetical protein|nr:hypothetical protein [Lactobacillaceae bacterium]